MPETTRAFGSEPVWDRRETLRFPAPGRMHQQRVWGGSSVRGSVVFGAPLPYGTQEDGRRLVAWLQTGRAMA